MSRRPHTHPDDTPGARLRDMTIGLAAAFVVILVAGLSNAAHAKAHQPTVPCARVAAVTGSTVAVCRAARIRHASTHTAGKLARACRIETDMPRDLCTALAAAIVRDKHPASWATSGALDELLDRESSHNANAVNPRSEACGWFQRLVKRRLSPGNGCPWRVTRVSQRRWIVHRPKVEQARNGLRYIAGRYGSPGAALRFHTANGWY